MTLDSQDRRLLYESCAILAFGLLALAVPALLYLAAYSSWMMSYDTAATGYWSRWFFGALAAALSAAIAITRIVVRSFCRK